MTTQTKQTETSRWAYGDEGGGFQGYQPEWDGFTEEQVASAIAESFDGKVCSLDEPPDGWSELDYTVWSEADVGDVVDLIAGGIRFTYHGLLARVCVPPNDVEGG